MSSSRPVYIPPNKRKRARFHGAFQGGFSAGYFNTVDTKEGWKPSVSKRQGEQRLEDFMDEQDHEEWGGPTQIRKDYNSNSAAAPGETTATTKSQTGETEASTSSKLPTTSVALLDSSSASASSSRLFFHISHQTVGPRLLRRLGWREDHERGTHSAFVPAVDEPQDENKTTASDENAAATKIVLSKKKLKQIQLQTSKIKLPPPKLDQCGLGFEAHLDAPEFRRHREKRQQMARERARGSATNNVYRTSNLLNDKDKTKAISDNNHTSSSQQHNNDYLSYETMEDFAGSRSVGGFALKDDEDDAYDTELGAASSSKPTLAGLGDEYNAEAYEHESDDDSDHGNHSHNNNIFGKQSTKISSSSSSKLATDFGGALASWAGTDTNSANMTTSVGVTSDGRAPIPGFVLGGSLESHKKRYPGPDIPRDYTLKPHQFKDSEHPRIFQTIARAVQLEEEEQETRNVARAKTATARLATLPPKPVGVGAPPPLRNTQQFAGLAAAMKNRFTSSTSSSKQTEESTNDQKVGLYQPEPISQRVPTVAQLSKVEEAANSQPKSIKIVRSIQSFVPHPLVCKRFGVPAPKHVQPSNNNTNNEPDHRSKEATYFEKEILPMRNQATQQKAANDKSKKPKAVEQGPVHDNKELEDEQEEAANEEPVGVERAPMEKLQSIFEPPSDSEESSEPDTDLDSLDGRDDNQESQSKGREPAKTKGTVQNGNDLQGTNSELVVVHRPNNEAPSARESEQQLVEYQSDNSSSTSSRQHKRKRKRKHHRRKEHKRRHRRKRSRSPDADLVISETEKEDRKQRRKRSRSDEEEEEEDHSSSEEQRERRERRRKKHDKKSRRKKSDRKRRKES